MIKKYTKNNGIHYHSFSCTIGCLFLRDRIPAQEVGTERTLPYKVSFYGTVRCNSNLCWSPGVPGCHQYFRRSRNKFTSDGFSVSHVSYILLFA